MLVAEAHLLSPAVSALERLVSCLDATSKH
jgi:hypothetical protein